MEVVRIQIAILVHPFRDSNGRAQRIFFEHVITNAEFEIYWKSIEQGEWIAANIAAVTRMNWENSNRFKR